MFVDLENLNSILVNIVADVFEKNKDKIKINNNRKIKFIFFKNNGNAFEYYDNDDSYIYSNKLVHFYKENEKYIDDLIKYISLCSFIPKIKQHKKYIEISWIIPNDIINIYDEFHYCVKDWLKLYVNVYNYLSNNDLYNKLS